MHPTPIDLDTNSILPTHTYPYVTYYNRITYSHKHHPITYSSQSYALQK